MYAIRSYYVRLNNNENPLGPPPAAREVIDSLRYLRGSNSAVFCARNRRIAPVEARRT